MPEPLQSVKQSTDARRRAERFFALHVGPEVLVLVNAWDAGSARVLEDAGAPAIATTSAGLAWSLGCPDGEHVPLDDFLAACARICRAVTVPVSVDIERGFGRSPAEVCEVVRALIGLGVVGVNIEDGVAADTGQLAAPEVLVERIAAVRDLVSRMSGRVFINARTDTYCVANRDRRACYDDTVRRAQLYAAAGADGIFVPGIDIEDLVPLARTATLPVNIYAGGGWAPPVHALRRAGVRRVSLGCGPLQSAFGLLRRVASEALEHGDYSTMSRGMLPAGDIDALFATSRAPTIRT